MLQELLLLCQIEKSDNVMLVVDMVITVKNFHENCVTNLFMSLALADFCQISGLQFN